MVAGHHTASHNGAVGPKARASPLGRAGRLPMKTLFLVRHAKSSRDDPTLSDRDRPLNDRGRHDAVAMARRLAGRGVKPDRLLSSPARRALSTARRFADGLGIERESIAVDDRLYAGTAGILLSVIQGMDDRAGALMLFGHNPEMSSLAQQLSGRWTDLPTCAVAEFRFDTARWSEVGAVGPSAVTIETPKD